MRKRKVLPITYEFMKDRVFLDGDVLMWAERPRSHFANDACFTRYARYSANTPCQGATTDSGHLSLSISGVRYQYHRIVYCIKSQADVPVDMEIDHENHIRSDNAPSNLRLVTHADNARNASLYRNNVSGAHGVRFIKGRWAVVCNRVSLGSFRKKADAIAASEAYRKEHGLFHSNHGK